MLAAFQALMTAFLGPANDLVNLGAKLQQVEGDINRLDDVLRYQRDPRSISSRKPTRMTE